MAASQSVQVAHVGGVAAAALIVAVAAITCDAALNRLNGDGGDACGAIADAAKCNATKTCAWCAANYATPTAGQCYDATTNSTCCSGYGDADCRTVAICTADETCHLPEWGCEYAGSPTCLSKKLVPCRNRHGVIGCPENAECCVDSCYSSSTCCAGNAECCSSAPCFESHCCPPGKCARSGCL